MTISKMTTKRKTADDLIDLCGKGYTIRLGTTTKSGHVYPAWQWQLFTPDGEFVKMIRKSQLAVVREAGLGDAIHGNFSELRGVNQ